MVNRHASNALSDNSCRPVDKQHAHDARRVPTAPSMDHSNAHNALLVLINHSRVHRSVAHVIEDMLKHRPVKTNAYRALKEHIPISPMPSLVKTVRKELIKPILRHLRALSALSVPRLILFVSPPALHVHQDRIRP